MRLKSLVCLIVVSFIFQVQAFAQPAPAAVPTTVIRFVASVDQNTVPKLMALIDQEIQNNTQRLILLISSPGGSVFYGMTAYNYLKGIPLEVITHNIGSADSIAALLFCAGKVRRSVPNGRFLIHSASLTFQGAGQLDEKALSERLGSLQADSNNIAAVIANTTGKNLEEVQRAIFEGTILTPEQAQTWGLVTEITNELFPRGTKVISVTSNGPPVVETAPGIALLQGITITEDAKTVSTTGEPLAPTGQTRDRTVPPARLEQN